MDISPLFSKIWIIESLKPGDIETGRSLYNDVLLPIKQSNPVLEIGIECPTDRVTFFAALNLIKKECDAGTYPMIHLECHGGTDGLQLGNNDIVKWEELRNSLIEINEASRLNVVIVVAACNGIHLIKVSTQLDRAPYWAVIGPTDEVYELDLKRDFASFYRKLLESMNGDDAMYALNKGVQGPDRPYHFHTSIGLFKRAYIAYHTNHCRGKGKSVRIENLVTVAMDNPVCQTLGIKEVRRQIKDDLAQEQQHFERKKKEFFFIDLYPENATRFPITYDDIILSLPS